MENGDGENNRRFSMCKMRFKVDYQSKHNSNITDARHYNHTGHEYTKMTILFVVGKIEQFKFTLAK